MPTRTKVAPTSFGSRLSFNKDGFALPFFDFVRAVAPGFLLFGTNIDIAMGVLLPWDGAQI